MTLAPPLREPVAVELECLSRSFGATLALDHLSLSLEPGELVALLGPSGCGKTTALRALAGLEDIDAGFVRVGGRIMNDVPANRRDMAMVFQSYSLFPHLTVADNVEFPLRIRGVDRAERARTVGDMLDIVGLAALGARYPHQLSGGQQQRVALARALAVRPQVLLLDEPLSALDAKVRVQLRDEIRRIQSETGITTLFVTHDQEEALAVADRVGVMRAGALVQLDAPETLYARPRDGFVAEFVGLSSRIPAVVEDGPEAIALGRRVPVLPASVVGEAELLVRPEHVRVAASPTASGAGAGVLVTRGFLGQSVHLHVRLDDGTAVHAAVRPREAYGLEQGDRVEIELDAVPALAVRPRAQSDKPSALVP